MKIYSLVHTLMLLIGFTISMIVFRVIYSGNIMYVFFIWNLLLAALPLGFSSLLLQTKKKFIQVILFTAWLLFFPNALYILTDLVHLRERYGVPFWYDIILVFSAAINGLILGYSSLLQVESFLRYRFSVLKTKLVLFSCLFLSSFGVYLGRFLRWNSWDIFSDPQNLFTGIAQRIINPADHPRAWGMTILLTTFSMIFYYAVKNLTDLNFKTKRLEG